MPYNYKTEQSYNDIKQNDSCNELGDSISICKIQTKTEQHFKSTLPTSIYATNYTFKAENSSYCQTEEPIGRGGLDGEERPNTTTYENLTFIFIIVIIALVSVLIRRKNITPHYILYLISRNDTLSTLKETRTNIELSIFSIIVIGINFFIALSLPNTEIFTDSPAIPIFISIIGITLIFILQQTAVWIIGYIFFSVEKGNKFCRINLLYYSLSGIVLVPGIIIYLCSMQYAIIGTYLSIAAMASLRIIFLFSVFKNFSLNLYNLFCIILYLCAVEIMPLFLMYNGVISALDFFCRT